MSEWQDLIVGDRMAVDQEFSRRVTESELSSQQWGLVMTATEFRVENADDPEHARLVADTSKVEHVASEMQTIDRRAGPMGPGTGGSGGGGSDGSGIVDTVKDALGLGGGGRGHDGRGDDAEAVLRRADRLTDEYADRLQERLENEGKWEEVRTAAADGTVDGDEGDPTA
ncbi:hypothetical protein BRD10_02175 [Halobacteriales archaeon SW_12_71_31]|nr:MAG: hypothetical protein BRD10_02175 [Halobacteriales archaeon SW_12_71_31]